MASFAEGSVSGPVSRTGSGLVSGVVSRTGSGMSAAEAVAVSGSLRERYSQQASQRYGRQYSRDAPGSPGSPRSAGGSFSRGSLLGKSLGGSYESFSSSSAPRSPSARAGEAGGGTARSMRGMPSGLGMIPETSLVSVASDAPLLLQRRGVSSAQPGPAAAALQSTAQRAQQVDRGWLAGLRRAVGRLWQGRRGDSSTALPTTTPADRHLSSLAKQPIVTASSLSRGKSRLLGHTLQQHHQQQQLQAPAGRIPLAKAGSGFLPAAQQGAGDEEFRSAFALPGVTAGTAGTAFCLPGATAGTAGSPDRGTTGRGQGPPSPPMSPPGRGYAPGSPFQRGRGPSVGAGSPGSPGGAAAGTAGTAGVAGAAGGQQQHLAQAQLHLQRMRVVGEAADVHREARMVGDFSIFLWLPMFPGLGARRGGFLSSLFPFALLSAPSSCVVPDS